MQTVILAGGEGVRLRPLTSDMPKPLVRILGESAIERLLSRLSKCGIKSAVICTHYLSEKMSEALGDECHGVKLEYRREETPLGTAGCVRSAWNGDDVMVLSGDGVCGFDYTKIIEYHRDSEADVTIVAREVSDPREYGLMTVDGDGRITGFVEKPGYDECLTNLANTGAYVISAGIMSRLVEGEPADFARDVFPVLLSEGKKLVAFVDKSYWYDIGDIPSLLKCQHELMESSKTESLIANTASVGRGSQVCGYSVIEENAAIGSGSRVMGSLISKGALIARSADISEAVVGENVTAGEGLIMKRYSVIGRDCVIGSSVTIEEGVRIAPRTRIPDGAIVRTDINDARFSTLSFTDGGEAMGVIGTSEILRLGIAIGNSLCTDSIVVGSEKVASTVAEAISLGLRSSGTAVYHLSPAAFGETVFAARKLESSHFVYVDSSEDIRLLTSSGVSLSRQEERKIEQAYSRCTDTGSASAPEIDGSALSALYIKSLRAIIPRRAELTATLRTDSLREAELFSELFTTVGGERITFSIASDRRTLSAFTKESVISYENLTVLCCEAYFEDKKSVVLPPRAPQCCDEIAKEYHSSVIRSESGTTPLTSFCFDPLMMAAVIVSYLTVKGISLEAAAVELPKIVYMKRVIDVPDGVPKIMREGFSGARVGGDVVLESAGARAFVRPMKSGRAVSMYIESVSQEAASELSADIMRRLKAKDKG